MYNQSNERRAPNGSSILGGSSSSVPTYALKRASSIPSAPSASDEVYLAGSRCITRCASPTASRPRQRTQCGFTPRVLASPAELGNIRAVLARHVPEEEE